MNKHKYIINLTILVILHVICIDLTIAKPKKHSNFNKITHYKKQHQISKKYKRKQKIYSKNNIKIDNQIIINNNIIDSNNRNYDLLLNAFSFLGIAYKYGSSTPMYGLDCSGFIQYIFKETVHVDLPRTAVAMYNVGTLINKKNQLKYGDLLFFNTIGKKISHVGMYIGKNQFIHAPRTGKNIEIQSLNNSYWSKKYINAKRVISDVRFR